MRNLSPVPLPLSLLKGEALSVPTIVGHFLTRRHFPLKNKFTRSSPSRFVVSRRAEPKELTFMSSDTITLRPALPEDQPFCLHLFSLVKTEELQAWHWDEALRARLMHMQFAAHEQHFRQCREPVSDYVVLVEPVAGTAQAIGRMVVLRGAGLHLADLTLLPEFRCRGIGGRLIGDLQAQAVDEGLSLRLRCNPGNPALRLYLRLGFQVIEPGVAHSLLEWRPQ